MASREEYLARLDLTKERGVEIGPADRPWLPPGPNIRYADYLSNEDLAKFWNVGSGHYDSSKLCEISYVLDKRPYREIFEDWHDLDVMAASHVIEHIPNLVHWLQELGSVLRPGGLLFLVAPHKRFEFDRLRRVTELNDILANYLEKRTQPASAAHLDCWLHFATVNGNATWWDEVDAQTLEVPHSISKVYSDAKAAADLGSYRDVHVSVFTPYSVLQLLHGLTLLELLPLELIDIDAVGIEIFLMFKKCPANQDVPRRLAELEKLAERFPFNIDDYFSGLLLLGNRTPDKLNTLPSGSMTGELQRAKEELERLKNSASWKITAPLRKMRRMFK
jgi:predicted SAM-dependent methyltransferase